MQIKIKKLTESAVLPTYAKEGDAGMDLTATWVDFDNEKYIEYGTGIAVEIPENYMGLIFPRSSNSKYDLQLCNAVGVIDPGYRGEIKLRFRRIINSDNITIGMTPWNEITFDHGGFEVYTPGERIGQLIIVPRPKVEWEEVDDLSETQRGDGGFGSSNK